VSFSFTFSRIAKDGAILVTDDSSIALVPQLPHGKEGEEGKSLVVRRAPLRQ
jgi:hypothetical protein